MSYVQTVAGAAFWLGLATAAFAGGTMEHQSFDSPALGTPLNAMIYIPEGAPPSAGWPVVYLLHGLGDNETSWRDAGNIVPTLDEMIANHLIAPALVVMPGAGASWYVDSKAVGGPGDYETAITRDLITAVQSSYPTRKDPGGRAIAGLSMGGAGALRLALAHPDLFVAAAALSPAIWQNVPEAEMGMDAQSMSLLIDSTYFHRDDPVDITEGVDLPPPPPHFGGAFGNPFDPRLFNSLNVFTLLASRIATNSPLPAMFVTVGDDDSHKLWRGAIAFYETMQADQRTVQFRVTDGDHSWTVWRITVRDALSFIDSQWQPAPPAP